MVVVVSGIIDRNIPYKVGATSGSPELGKVETNNMFDITRNLILPSPLRTELSGFI